MREGAGEGEERNGTSKAATKSREVLPSFLPSRAERCIHRAHEEEEEEGEERNGSLAGSKDMARSFLLRGDRPRKCSARVSGPRLERNCFEAEGKRERLRATIAFAGLVSGLEPRLMVSGIWAGP